MDKFPDPIVVAPRQAHTHTIILLHGRNSSGAEFAQELFEGTTSSGRSFASRPVFHGCKWIFPTARATFSEQFQEDLTEWFDLASTSSPYAEAEKQKCGLKDSMAYVNSIIERELECLPASRIVLGGMSQGFATAVHVLLTRTHAFGGFVGISGWLPFYPEMLSFLQQPSNIPVQYLAWFYAQHLDITLPTLGAATSTLMLVTHSQDDDVIDIERGRDVCSLLGILGSKLTFQEYADGGHEIQEPHGYDDLEKFLATMICKKKNNG